MRPGHLARLGIAVAVRPWLWRVAVVQAHRLAGRGWWRRFPFLPVPDPAYARFRSLTQYGDPDQPPDLADVLVWLRWVRRFPGSTSPPAEPG